MKLIGNKPNQVPTNGMLGTMAFQDAQHPNIGMPFVNGAPIVERGDNANGRFMRFADGTQICTAILTAPTNAAIIWTFPAAFLVGVPTHPVAMAYGSHQLPMVSDGGTNLQITVAMVNPGSSTPQPGAMSIAVFGRWK